MVSTSHSAARGTRPRGVRLILVGTGLAAMALLAGWSVMEILDMFNQGHPLRAAFLAVVTFVILSLSISAIAVNWRSADAPATRPSPPAESADQSGIWGVGGPSMREPGSTGVWPTRKVDRRYESRDD